MHKQMLVHGIWCWTWTMEGDRKWGGGGGIQMWEWVKAEHEKQQKEWEQREGERFRERSIERTWKHSSGSLHQERFQENRRLWIQCGVTIVFTLERWIVVTILCPWDVNYKRWHTPTNLNINLNHQLKKHLITNAYTCLCCPWHRTNSTAYLTHKVVMKQSESVSNSLAKFWHSPAFPE